MKKLILLFSVIMLISIVSCSSNLTLISQIVGSWENQYSNGTKIFKQKYTFNRDKTLNIYADNGTNTYTKIGSGNYAIDNDKSRLTINFTEMNGENVAQSITTTFAIGDNKMAMSRVMVGGDTNTLIGIWSTYLSANKSNFYEMIYDFKDDGTITATATMTEGTEKPITEISNAIWVKDSDSKITFSNSDNEDLLPNGSYSYQIIGQGLILDFSGFLEMTLYIKVKE
jgi:hypothetical protein